MNFQFYKQRKASVNYSANMMPTTRGQVFRDILHLHFWKVLAAGLILLIFSLPLHIVDLYEDIYIAELTSQITDATAQSEIDAISYNVIAFKNVAGLVKIPFYILLSIGLAGVLRIIRQYCWIENVSIKHDFAVGVKQNLRQTFAFVLLFGVFSYICSYLINMSYIVGEQDYSVFLFIPTALNALIVFPIVLIGLVCVPVYSNTFLQNIKIAIRILLKKYLKIILATFVAAGPFIILSQMGFYFNLFIRLIYSLGGGFVIIGFCLFMYNVLDKQINGEYFPDLVGRGTIWNELN